jgi:hypothetical protein
MEHKKPLVIYFEKKNRKPKLTEEHLYISSLDTTVNTDYANNIVQFRLKPPSTICLLYRHLPMYYAFTNWTT